jgi:hypothetical protein
MHVCTNAILNLVLKIVSDELSLTVREGCFKMAKSGEPQLQGPSFRAAVHGR